MQEARLLILLALVVDWSHGQESSPPSAKPNSQVSTPFKLPGYRFEKDHDLNGTGKIFMGREIALVMGHQGADWLERPEREEEEEPERMVDALELKQGDHVADIGAGTGFIAAKLAKRVGTKGQVYGVDIQPEMLSLMRFQMKKKNIENVTPVQGTTTNPNLPEGKVDLIVMVDVYHEFSHPYEMTINMLKGLKKGGRLVFVEYRKEDPEVPIKEIHKMSEAQVKYEMSIHPLKYVKTSSILPRQHIIIFEKTDGESQTELAQPPRTIGTNDTTPRGNKQIPVRESDLPN